MLIPQLIGMVAPGAGAAGGIIALSIFVIMPIAFLLHCLFKRTLAVITIVSILHFAFWAVIWVLYEYLDPNSGDRKWFAQRILWLTLIAPLITTTIAAIPVVLFRLYYEDTDLNQPTNDA